MLTTCSMSSDKRETLWVASRHQQLWIRDNLFNIRPRHLALNRWCRQQTGWRWALALQNRGIGASIDSSSLSLRVAIQAWELLRTDSLISFASRKRTRAVWIGIFRIHWLSICRASLCSREQKSHLRLKLALFRATIVWHSSMMDHQAKLKRANYKVPKQWLTREEQVWIRQVIKLQSQSQLVTLWAHSPIHSNSILRSWSETNCKSLHQKCSHRWVDTRDRADHAWYPMKE